MRTRRQHFGQHFLNDSKIIRSIVSEALSGLSGTAMRLLEIGPGDGALTLPIVEEIQNIPEINEFYVCEKDPKIIQYWQNSSNRSRMLLLEGDFLHLDPKLWLPKNSLKLRVVSNLPYSSGTPILTLLSTFPNAIDKMVLMFQAEVAKRLYAVPRTKEWGTLSLFIQNYWSVEKFLVVPPESFDPPPKVMSEVVKLVPRVQPKIDVSGDPILWEKLLKVCFIHRRKMLRAGLPKNSVWSKALIAANIAPTSRAEELNWDDWKRFYEKAKEFHAN